VSSRRARDAEAAAEAQQHAVEPLRHLFEVNRRDLFKLLGAGMVVGMCAHSPLAQESGAGGHGEEIPRDIASWLHIGADGKITVFTGKVEMGQNIRTSLAQQVAEELRTNPYQVTMIMGDTDLVPFDLGTFGSRTTPQMGSQLRKVAAAARGMLIDMAAERWHAEAATLVAQDGAVTNPATKQSFSYSQLTEGKKLVKVLERDPALTPPAQWRVAGQVAPKVGGKAFVTGVHQYTSDLTRPGMMYGAVLRPKAFNARLVTVDTKPAEQLPNVKVVHDGDFVGVAAPDPESAANALGVISAEWDAPNELSEAALFDSLRQAADPESRGGGNHESGSVETAMAAAAKTLARTYTVAYIQHAPLETRAAVAEWESNKLTVWTGTQRPFAVREELAAAFHLPLDQVRVLVPDTGSAYGGKHTGECAVEAARLAKAAGKPVKLAWTREEEFSWAYFRPAGVIEVNSGIAADGLVTAWEFHNYNSGPAAIGTPYNVVNQKIQFHPAKNPPLRQGSYRGLAATANFFARESHMDELAHLAGMDPLAFRLKNLTDTRLRAVFEIAAKRFGWGKPQPGGTALKDTTRGVGIAGGFEKGGYIATCAEVAVDRRTGRVKIARVAQSFDCGAVINPDGLRNQISGAIVQGIGGALFEAVHFDNGRILNPHFSQYRVPRFSDLPQIEVELVFRMDQPSMGAGETPLLGLAPAVANAIFNATGIRLRSLPLMAKPLALSS
jgi:CO/xanthine dehydrogenase Mo-binding subunit